jgi:uncharacterized protein (TIGR02466 family)
MAQLSMKKRSYFPTLMYSFDLPDAQSLNDRLLPFIYAEREQDQNGIQRSNYRDLGGWHSQTNLHKSPDFGILVEKIDEAGRLISDELGYHESYSLQVGTMWSVINPPGSSNLAHIHPGCIWSGVYYVQAPRNSGKILFTDPRTENLMQNPKYIPNKKRSKPCLSKVRYTPVAGRMLIFPSWLYHAVKPNLSEEKGANGERIIVSFNLSQRKDQLAVKRADTP